MSDELKPCPFPNCGAVIQLCARGTLARCPVHTGWVNITAWNQRATTQRQAELELEIARWVEYCSWGGHGPEQSERNKREERDQLRERVKELESAENSGFNGLIQSNDKLRALVGELAAIIECAVSHVPFFSVALPRPTAPNRGYKVWLHDLADEALAKAKEAM